MILFSSFSHFHIFLMFLYLGVLSGIEFFLVYFSCKKLKNFNFKIDKNLLKQNKLKPKAAKQKTIKQTNLNKAIFSNKENLYLESKGDEKSRKKNKKKKPPNKEVLKKINNLTKRFLTIVKIMFNKFKNIFLCVLNLTTLCAVVCLSYYANFVFNMGHLRIIYIIVWMIAFIFSYSLAKKVAKTALNFYNYLIKRKRQKKSQPTKFK